MIESLFSLSRNTLNIICLAMITGMLLMGLWPFNYHPSNQVSILKDGTGIRFYGRGEAVSVGNSGWPLPGYTGQPITLELSLRPHRAYHESVPHILSLCDSSGREIFYLGQWKNHLVMRLLSDNRWFTRVEREKGTPDLLHTGQPVFLTFVFNAGRVELYADGTLAEVYDGFDLIGTIARRPVRSIVLGNSARSDSPWKGEIRGFSVSNGALDPIAVRDRYRQRKSGEKGTIAGEVIHYRFDEPFRETVRNEAGQDWDLLIPETLTPLRRELLSLPSRQNLGERWFYVDALVNLAGFIPLGFFLAMLFRIPGSTAGLRAFALVLAIGALLSLFIEANQTFLVTRNSSMTDLILNSLGAMAGVLLFMASSRSYRSRQSG